MNTKTLALFASLVVLTTVARAAQFPIANEMIILPTYTVEAPRYTPVEKRVNASLDEMRRQASVPLAVPAESPALKAIQESPELARQILDKKAARLVKA